MAADGVDQAQECIVIYNGLRGVVSIVAGAGVRAIVDYTDAVKFMKSSVPRVELRIAAKVVVHAGYNVIGVLGIAATRIRRHAILNPVEEGSCRRLRK